MAMSPRLDDSEGLAYSSIDIDGECSPMPVAGNRQAAAEDVRQLLSEAVARHQQDRLEDAERLYSAVLAVQPEHAVALHHLGLIRFAAGRFGEALQLIASAMRAQGPTATLWLHQGLVLNALGQPADAVASFERAIALDSRCFDAHHNRAVLISALGRNEEALHSCRQALAIAPQDAGALFNQGNILKDMGRLEEAVASYDRALAAQPAHAAAWCNRGVVLHMLRRLDEALTSFDRAIAAQPAIAEAHSNRGNVLRDLGRHEDALASYDRALKLRPDYPEALSNRGNALNALKRPHEALGSYDRALALRPDYAEAWCNRAAALHDLGRYEEALASCERALALRPDYAEAFSNRGATLTELKRYADAAADYAQAMALEPDMPEPHWNQATLSLLTGDFARGWAEYEWRWRRETLARTWREFAQPVWRGKEDVAGKTVLLHSEQGLGDTIQFCRYVPLVAARGARVIIEVEQPLRRLMATLPGAIEIVGKGDPLPHFDLHCPLLSLPLAFNTRLETVPCPGPYLSAVAEEEAVWAARLAPLARPRVGLVWSGNPTHHRDAERSISLATLDPLLDAGASFVSVQKNVRAIDAAALRARDGIVDVSDALTDFAATAALLMQLDLLITVDTSVAHLAGALGRPAWIMISHTPDWRWLLDRESTPWYPSVRLFRQDETRRWAPVVDRVRQALGQWIAC